MSITTLVSTFAMLLGLGAIVPQIVRMVRARSAAGQSPVGWLMGLGAHLSMAYVNGTAFQAVVLTTSNLMAAGLCALSLTLILVMARRAPSVADAPETPGAAELADLATKEFVVLRDAVLAADAARRPGREIAPAA
jgi:hypothetical protein